MVSPTTGMRAGPAPLTLVAFRDRRFAAGGVLSTGVRRTRERLADESGVRSGSSHPRLKDWGRVATLPSP